MTIHHDKLAYGKLAPTKKELSEDDVFLQSVSAFFLASAAALSSNFSATASLSFTVNLILNSGFAVHEETEHGKLAPTKKELSEDDVLKMLEKLNGYEEEKEENAVRPRVAETTALGAAYLAGLCTGFWESIDELKKIETADKIYSPHMPELTRFELLNGWKKAVDRTLEK